MLVSCKESGSFPSTPCRDVLNSIEPTLPYSVSWAHSRASWSPPWRRVLLRYCHKWWQMCPLPPGGSSCSVVVCPSPLHPQYPKALSFISLHVLEIYGNRNQRVCSFFFWHFSRRIQGMNGTIVIYVVSHWPKCHIPQVSNHCGIHSCCVHQTHSFFLLTKILCSICHHWSYFHQLSDAWLMGGGFWAFGNKITTSLMC